MQKKAKPIKKNSFKLNESDVLSTMKKVEKLIRILVTKSVRSATKSKELPKSRRKPLKV